MNPSTEKLVKVQWTLRTHIQAYTFNMSYPESFAPETQLKFWKSMDVIPLRAQTFIPWHSVQEINWKVIQEETNSDV